MKQEQEIELLQNEMERLGYLQSLYAAKLAALKTVKEESVHCNGMETLKDNPWYQKTATKKLSVYFHSLGYSITELSTVSEATNEQSKQLEKLADQIWRCRHVSKPFIKELSKQYDKKFIYDMSSLSLEEANDFLNLCGSLLKMKWISFSKPVDKHIEITADIPKDGRYFLSGAWAEIINRKILTNTLQKFASERGQFSYKLFWNVKLKKEDSTKNNGNDMQLDLVVQLSGGFYIFETKSGYNLAIDKWVDRTRLFCHDKNRFITCCADENLSLLVNLPYYLFALPRLEKQILDLLERDYPVQEEAGAQKVQTKPE